MTDAPPSARLARIADALAAAATVMQPGAVPRLPLGAVADLRAVISHFAVLFRRRATDARWQWYACALTDGESDAVLAALNKPDSLVEARRISIADLPNG